MRGGLSPGQYFILCYNRPDKCLDDRAQNSNNRDGRIELMTGNRSAHQQWNIASDSSRPGRFTIQSTASEGYLQPDGLSGDEGKEIHYSPRVDSGFQAWVFISVSGDTYQIKNDGSGKYLVPDSEEDEAKIKQTGPLGGGTGSYWKLQPVSKKPKSKPIKTSRSSK